MKRVITAATLAFGLVLATVGGAFADSHAPSTNDQNRENGWAHFNVLENEDGAIEVEFVSERDFWSCFEYRVDDEEPTVEGENPNPAVEDGRWTQVCVNNSTVTRTIEADEHVDIRMVYGAESDERFDWTRVEVVQPEETDEREAGPAWKEHCEDGGWEDAGYRNEGQCVSEAARDR
jgi:hypothetical protein